LTGATIDIQSLATQLTNATQAPQQALLDTRKKEADAKISSIGLITSSANDFQTALTSLGDPKAIAYSTQSSDTSVADFSFKSFVQPKPINFSFTVNQLATANQVTLPPIPASASGLLGSSSSRVLTLYGGQSFAPATILGATPTATVALHNPNLTPGTSYTLSVPTDVGTNLSVSVTVPDSGTPTDFTSAVNDAITAAAAASSPAMTSGFPTASLSADGGSLNFKYAAGSAASGDITMTADNPPQLQQFDLAQYASLSDLAAAIGKVSGFTATVMNAPSSNGGMQYLQISHGSGQANNFFATITDPNSSGPLTDGLNTDVNKGAIVQAGQDAVINAAGVEYRSPSNAFSDLISGVTINVHALTASTSPVTLSTATNTTGLISGLQTIVNGYNSLISTLKAQIQYDANIAKRGGLANDSVAKSFMLQLRSLTTTPITGTGPNPITLSEVGIKTNLDGTLSIDTATLDTISQSNPQLLADAISSTNSSKGAIDLMTNLNSIITGVGSPFQSELTQTQGTVEQKIADDQTKLDTQMTALHQRYITQFTAMQDILNSTKTEGTSLTSMMAAWTAGLKG
jgi:flagellar hook-associated protein 2